MKVPLVEDEHQADPHLETDYMSFWAEAGGEIDKSGVAVFPYKQEKQRCAFVGFTCFQAFRKSGLQ